MVGDMSEVATEDPFSSRGAARPTVERPPLEASFTNEERSQTFPA
jgi:hypothetical protein